MKVLSVQQPWASLICAGIKDVENRTWKAAKVPGRILIHASSKKVTRNFYAGIPEYMESIIKNEVGFGNIPALDTLPTSAIIEYVTVKGFEEGKSDSLWADGPGVIKWELEDAWMFDEPIQNVKGKLNLFDYDEVDEDNLPPAHQVPLSVVVLNDNEDEVFIPCEENTFEQIKSGELDSMQLYLEGYLYNTLCVESTLEMKPFKAVTIECGNEFVKFELKGESGIFALPDPEDETKPYVIQYPDGSECGWLIADFVFGKKLDEGELVGFCGGIKKDMIDQLMKN